jgi:hypothetical protein
VRGWVLAAVLLLAACGGAPAASRPSPQTSNSSPATRGTPAPPAPGIEAEAVQLRTDAAVGGRIQVRVTATGDEPFTVTSVALDSPGFEAQPAVEVSTEFERGRVVDLRVPLGPVRCDVAPEPAAARLTVVRGGGAAEELRVPLAAEVLVRLHAAGCAAEALADVATLEVSGLRLDGDEMVGDLALVRRSGTAEVRATRIQRNVLIEVAAELPLVLAGDAPEVTGEVRFTGVNCEPHVLSEIKQPFRFPIGIEVDGQDEVVVDLPVPAGVRSRLQEFVDHVCG